MKVKWLWLAPLLLLTACSGPAEWKAREIEGERNRMFTEQESKMLSLANQYYLSVTELIPRWNALADASAIPEIKLEEERMKLDLVLYRFEYTMPDGGRLSGAFNEGGWITSMTYSAVPSMDHVEMLLYWSMIIASTNSDILPNEVDAYFNELGIGPDGDIDEATYKQITIQNGTYRVDKYGKQINFIFTKDVPRPIER